MYFPYCIQVHLNSFRISFVDHLFDFVSFDLYSQKYHDGSIFLVLKSLAYFDDADEQEMPFMFHNTSWQTMKNNIKKALADYILPGG